MEYNNFAYAPSKCFQGFRLFANQFRFGEGRLRLIKGEAVHESKFPDQTNQ